MTEKRTIQNGNGKRLDMMIEPSNAHQPNNGHVEWRLSKNQWYRLVAESDNTQWYNEDGYPVMFTCVDVCRTAVTYPGLR